MAYADDHGLTTLGGLTAGTETESRNLDQLRSSLRDKPAQTRIAITGALVDAGVRPDIAEETAWDVHRQLDRAATAVGEAAQELHTLSECLTVVDDLLAAHGTRRVVAIR